MKWRRKEGKRERYRGREREEIARVIEKGKEKKKHWERERKPYAHTGGEMDTKHT